MIVQYYADSLGLSRPGIVTLQQRYIYIFEKWLRKNVAEDIYIINRAKRGATIDILYNMFKEDEEYIEGEKDVLIIHEGVCDCAPRPISESFRKIISVMPGFVKTRIIHYLHYNRAKILKNGSAHFLVSQEQYELILSEWLTRSVKKFKRIYIFTIAPTNEEIERHSPGFGASVKKYNQIIKDVAERINDAKIYVVDVHSAIAESLSIDNYITKEDGHHLTSVAHELYAEMLIGREKEHLQ